MKETKSHLPLAWLLGLLCAQGAWAGPSSVGIADNSVTQSPGSTINLDFTLTRSGDSGYDVVVPYATVNDSAVAGTDYTATTGSATIAAGASTATVSVPVLAGSNAVDKSFFLNLASATGVGPTPDFAAQQTFAAGTGPRSAAAVDINGDGRPDLLVANTSANTVSVLLNTTAPGASVPTFAAQVTFAVGSRPESVTAADINGDGLPDLLVANQTTNNVSVLLNTTAPGATTPSFATQQTFPLAGNGSTIAAADMNGDGRLDLLVANGAATVSVLLNTTAPGAAVPSFAAQQTFAAGNDPASVVASDLNGDGRPDLLVANILDATVSVFLNTTLPGATTISFTPQQTFATGSFPRAAAADVNGDGRPDLLVANQFSSTVSVLLNTTAPGALVPSFAAQQTFATGNSPVSVVASDLNGDGRLDLVLANQGGTVSVLFNRTAPGAASPSFSPQQSFAAGSLPSSVVATDLNGDGRPDLVVANQGNNVSILLNSTAPGAAAPNFAAQQIFATGIPASVAAADVNGDGRPDLLVANQNGNTVSVLLNTTAPGAVTPSFAAQQTFTTGSGPSLSVAAADVNGDGLPDLLVAKYSANIVSVLLNTTAPGAATPSFAAQQSFATGSTSVFVAAADVNGDGRPDLLVANANSANVSVLLNTTAPGAAAPSFAAQQTFATGVGPFSVAAADVNGDGRPDLLVANDGFNANTVSVLLNTTAPGAATPSFAAQQTFATGSTPVSVAAADVNGDGRPDLLVANFDSNTVSVLLNTTAPGAATPSFAAQQSFATGSGPVSVAVGDFNGDGRPDLLVANLNGNTVSVLLNTTAPGAAAPSFAAQQTFATGSAVSVAAADVNGDGRPDLLVANQSSNTVSVLLNTQYRSGLSPAFAVGTIHPAPASLSINDVTQAEGNSGTTAFTFTVSLSGAATSTVTVNYATANGTATTSSGDYVGASGILSFAPGVTSQPVTVNVGGDTTFEPDETFTVTLSGASGATITDGSGLGTITNDDVQPAVSFSQASQSVSEGVGSVSLTVNLSNASSQAITVPFTVSGTADAGDRSLTTASPLSFAPGETTKTLDLSITDDTLVEPNETVVLTLSTPTNATLGNPSSQTVTILDNDPAADITPDAFSFIDVSNVALGSAQVSNSITVGGINAASPVTVSGGFFGIGSGPCTQTSGSVVSGDQVRVCHTASSSYSTATNTTLTIGASGGLTGVSDTFTSTTQAATTTGDTTPDRFKITAAAEVEPNSVNTTSVRITGINVPTPVSVSGGGGMYSIAGGGFTSAPGLVTNGQTITLQLVAPPNYNARSAMTLTVGTYSDDYKLTTKKLPK